MKHSIVGASGAKRWMNCPLSVTLQKELGDIEFTTSKAAEEGTAAHELAEICLITGLPSSTYLGKIINNVEVNQEMVDVISHYVATVLSFGGELHVETEFHLEHLNPALFGTNDVCIILDDTLIVLDLKYGKGTRVDAEGNPQLKYYALGALALCPPTVTKVQLGIIQKRFYGKDPIDIIHTTKEELVSWGFNVLKPAADKALSGSKEGKRGDWCHFCKSKAICPIISEKVFALCKNEFKPITKKAEEIVLPEVASLSKEELTRIKMFAPIAESWIKSVNEYVKAKAIAEPGYFPDMKIVRGKKSRSWKNKEEAESYFSTVIGEKAYKKSFQTVKQVEDACKKLGIQLPENFVNTKQGTALVSIMDKKEAYNPNQKMFDNIENK